MSSERYLVMWALSLLMCITIFIWIGVIYLAVAIYGVFS